jgi:outer membrane protein assembly factor BamB
MIAASILVSIAALPRLAAADWPEWRGPDRAGVWADVKLPGRLEAAHVKVKWRQPLGGGYAGISVVGDRVLTQDRQGGDERVICLTRDTGKTLWTHGYPADYGKMEYANGPRTTPTVRGGRVYAQGAVGHIVCLDLATGAPRWKLDTLAAYGGKLPQWGHAASGLIAGDCIVFQAGGPPGPTLVALELETGKERWRAMKDRPGYSAPALQTIQGRRQIVHWSAESVAGLDAGTGEVLWQAPYASTYDVAIHSPVFHDGLLLVSGYWEGSKALRFAAAGAPVEAWGGKALSLLMSTPLFRDGHLYGLDKSKGIACVEWQSGKVLWTDGHQATPRDRNPQAAMVWAGERAAIFNAKGELILASLTPGGYEEHGRVPITGETWAHPAFAGQEVFARSDTEIVAVEVRDSGREEKQTTEDRRSR